MEYDSHHHYNEENDIKYSFIKIILSFLMFIIFLCIPKDAYLIKIILFIISYSIVGYEVIIKALQQLWHGMLIEESFLMTIATIGAICIGEYEEALFVMLFYQIGELFQDYATDKSRRHVKELLDIRPDYVHLKIKNSYKDVLIEEVSIGDIIAVYPGEKIPLDGEVISGNSFLNTKFITGESIPRSVTIQDEVISGCVNELGVLEIRVLKNASESTVTQILNMVENASNKKTKHENFMTKFSKIYTPIVVLCAIILCIIPPLFFHLEWKVWFYRALSFLVVSCPCALVISIPLSYFAGIGVLAREGILIKGSQYILLFPKIKKLVFDKTGTLTKGVFEVQTIQSKKMKEEKLLELVAHAEAYSHHPIALSIQSYYQKEINFDKIKEVKEIAGYGIEGIVFNKNILVGNEKLMKKHHIIYEKAEEAGTILYVAIDKSFEGYILISDEIKENIENSMKLFHDKYKFDLIMLTGDKKEVSHSLSKKLNITEYYSELLPKDKYDKMNEFIKNKKDNEVVAFIGDGMNDAPVLALSDLGIAMGGIGSEAAIEAADAVIMDDDILKIDKAINISKTILRIVLENIIFSISIKIIILILCAFGIASMWSAVFADVGVTVLVVLNSLRLFWQKF